MHINQTPQARGILTGLGQAYRQQLTGNNQVMQQLEEEEEDAREGFLAILESIEEEREGVVAKQARIQSIRSRTWAPAPNLQQALIQQQATTPPATVQGQPASVAPAPAAVPVVTTTPTQGQAAPAAQPVTPAPTQPTPTTATPNPKPSMKERAKDLFGVTDIEKLAKRNK
jgi:hypothetical protein